MSALVSRLRDESGQALVEFALMASVFLLVLLGMVDYAIYTRDEMELTEAAAAAATYGSTPGMQKSTNWATSIASMQTVAAAAAPDVANVTTVASYFYTCTPGGTHVASTATCSRTAPYTTPLMYVTVQVSATVPAMLKWVGLANSLNLGGRATYRVPWTQ